MNILEQIKNSTYSTQALTQEKFKKIIDDTFANFEPTRKVTLFTGILGMFFFDLSMKGLNGYALPKFTYHICKKSRCGTIFNLYNKHGNFKIKLTFKDGVNILDLRYVTQSLGIFNSFEDCMNKLKTMKLV